jgi:hypothetical protein
MEVLIFHRIYNDFKYITDARAVDYEKGFQKYSDLEITLDPLLNIII